MERLRTPLKIFVTYSGDDTEHTSDVLAFTNMLRQNGYDANVDKEIAQRRSSLDFNKMMFDYLEKSDKVIIVLSPKYKKKANKRENGVGVEYEYILNDIDKNINKYIIVSFLALNKTNKSKIIPKEFLQRDIIDLKNDQVNEFIQLHSRIQNKPLLQFDTVNDKTPEINIEKIKTFDLLKKKEKKINEPSDVVGHLATIISTNSYYEYYHTKIDCIYHVIDGIPLVKKRVISNLKLINPDSNSIKEADLFTPYIFKKIPGINNKDYLKVKRFKIKIDNQDELDLENIEVISSEDNYTQRSNYYDERNCFEYKLNNNGFQDDLIIQFENELKIDIEEERIVPISDKMYIKRLNKLTKDFKLTYTFHHHEEELFGTLFGTLSKKENVMVDDTQKDIIKISHKGWLLPGDGVIIVSK